MSIKKQNIALLSRYQGDNGFRLLVEALRSQPLVAGNETVARAFAKEAKLAAYHPRSTIITQGEADNDLYFIISGSVDIVVNGRAINRRHAGQHVGEMALIDPKARRSATVIAAEETIAAKIAEPQFTAIADAHPRLWRSLALEIADRLRQRSRHVPLRNDVPRVFIGSSRECLEVANSIKFNLVSDALVVTIWTDGVFQGSKSIIESLKKPSKTPILRSWYAPLMTKSLVVVRQTRGQGTMFFSS